MSLPVPSIEYRLLERLSTAGRDGASMEDLLLSGWGPTTRRSSNVLAVHIRNLRCKLEAAKAGVRIDSVRDFGYVLCWSLAGGREGQPATDASEGGREG